MNQTFAVQFSVIEPKELLDRILSRYDLRPISCRFYTPGVNDIYIVNCQEGTFYLKISLHNYINKEEIAGEVQAVCQLVRNGIAVAAPVCDQNGVYVQDIYAPEGIRYAVLWCEAKGEIKGIKSKEENRNLGILLGQIHQQLDGVQVKRRTLNEVYMVDQPLSYIKEYYGTSPYIKRLEAVGDIIKSYLKTAMVDTTQANSVWDIGLCHGDTHNYNIRYEGGHPILFDFDCAAYGLRAYDLAVQRWNIAMFEMSETEEEEQWQALLEGYGSVRNLDKIDVSNINILVAARNLWLMGLQLNCIHYNRGCDWLNEDWIKWNTEFIEKWMN